MSLFLPGDPGVANIGTGTISSQQSAWERITSTVTNAILTGIALFRTPKSSFITPPTVGGVGSASGAAAPPLAGISNNVIIAGVVGVLGLGLVFAFAGRRR